MAMTIHLCTFSDDSMSRSAELCFRSALRNGVDFGRVFTDQDIGAWFLTRDTVAAHQALFDSPRGCGYWAWKPLLVNALLTHGKGSANDDIFIYSDAGVEFINNVSHIIERMDQDIFLFGNNWEHAHWCKRDVVDEVWELLALDQPYYDYSFRFGGEPKRDEDNYISWENFGKQCQASVIFFRVSDYSKQFVKEWLDWCLFEGGRLIDDSPSRTPNHPEFREHRHDQAILTTLAYREGIKLHWWPSVYNRGGAPEFVYEKLPEYAADTYPVLFSHHRKRNHEWDNAA